MPLSRFNEAATGLLENSQREVEKGAFSTVVNTGEMLVTR